MRDERLLVLTDRGQLPVGRSLVDHVGRCVDAGLRAVCLRERDLPEDARADLAARLADVVHPVGGLLLVASPVPQAARPFVDGEHLRAADPLPARPLPLTGRSTHTRDEVQRALAERLAWITLSPYAVTASKPGYGPVLGATGFRRVLSGLDLGNTKVLALGGISPTLAAEAREAGAHGAAVMGEVMRAEDPAGVIRDLLAALA